ncbi:transporter [Sphingobium sp. AR-3-1]|uniref:Transporter n=1 Tax=Sphingobium psychrophilum TaxID=2728834 RepID=A0A7X9ZSN8_9SPHN|nr:transporter [Sphingobium psychrophilum]NML09746.1 transporter [Sphingobium psychrophilum]
MRMMAAAALALAPGMAMAQEPRDLCADRPGLGTPACTVEPGRMVVELGLGDWTRQQDISTRTDTIQAGDALVRLGLGDHLEAQVGWTAYGHVRTRDRLSGLVEKDSGVGDVQVALRRNLSSPDGSGFSIAIMPYVSLPAGGSAIGAGDWGAGLIVPVSFDLGGGLSLGLTPQIDAAVDGDRDGRHVAYGSVAGLGFSLSDSVSGTIEAQVTRDEDPAGHATEALAGLSFAWQPSDDMQFDIGTNIGLNADSPDSQAYLGVVRRF